MHVAHCKPFTTLYVNNKAVRKHKTSGIILKGNQAAGGRDNHRSHSTCWRFRLFTQQPALKLVNPFSLFPSGSNCCHIIWRLMTFVVKIYCSPQHPVCQLLTSAHPADVLLPLLVTQCHCPHPPTHSAQNMACLQGRKWKTNVEKCFANEQCERGKQSYLIIITDYLNLEKSDDYILYLWIPLPVWMLRIQK